MEIDVVSVPFSATGRAGGAAAAPAALHAQGLVGRLRAVLPDNWTPVEPPPVASGERSLLRNQDSALLNESGLVAMIDGVADTVAASHRAGRLPLLLGGDGPVLLGGLVATGHRSDGPAGLLALTGRECAWPPNASPTGQASDCTLGLALVAQTNAALFDGLARRLPLVPPQAVALLGPRDAAELTAAGIPSLAGSILIRSDQQLGGPTRTAGPALTRHATDAVEHVRTTTPRWWLHVDLNVLATAELPAVDHSLPGGLNWEQLTALTRAALSAPGLIGWSVTNYDPDLDLARSGAARIATYLVESVSALPPDEGQFTVSAPPVTMAVPPAADATPEAGATDVAPEIRSAPRPQTVASP